MSNTKHFPSFSVVNGHVKVQVDLTRFDKQFQEAQFWLDGQVMNDMIPYMPFRDGIMVDATRVRSASMQALERCAQALHRMDGSCTRENLWLIQRRVQRGRDLAQKKLLLIHH